MNTNEFLKYLKSQDFPKKKYNAIYNYPGTEYKNNKYENDFNKKYKKKFLYPHEDKNIVQNNVADNLFFYSMNR